MKKISVILLSFLFLFSSCTALEDILNDEDHDSASGGIDSSFADFFDDAFNGNVPPLLSEFADRALEAGRINSIKEILPEDIMDPERFGYNTRQLICNQTAKGYEISYSEFTGVYHFGEIVILEASKDSVVTIDISYLPEGGEVDYYVLCGDNLILLDPEQNNKIQMDTLKCSVILVGNSTSGDASFTISSDSALQITMVE